MYKSMKKDIENITLCLQRWRQICKGTKLQQNFVFTTLLFEKDVGNMILECASSHNLKKDESTEKCQFLPSSGVLS